jgi:hypothetical protein
LIIYLYFEWDEKIEKNALKFNAILIAADKIKKLLLP